MKTIKIYGITRTEAYQMAEQGTGYSLSPYGKSTLYYKGYDDGGTDYIIPDGFTVEKGADEQLHFYDDRGSYCKLVSHYGKPALIIDDGCLILKSAAAAALGKKGGSVKSEAKSRASRENGKLGGRPRIIEDGWHTISGYDCCVEGGIVLRAVIGEGNSQTSGYPYRFDKKLGVWNKCTPKVATLKNGLAKGTYEIM